MSKDEKGIEFELVRANKSKQMIIEPEINPVVEQVEHPQTGLDGVPKIFCANKEIAKGLLIDMFAMVGTLKAIETNEVNVETLPIVLQNAQNILTSLSDVLIRDCGLTDVDLDDVMSVFTEANAEAMQQISRESPSQETITVVPTEEKKDESRTQSTSTGANIL
jgi:hypothetical protein